MVKHVVGILLLVAPAVAAAQEVKVYENGGVKWQETRQVVPRPVYETKMVEQKQTVYREEIKTEQQTTYRNFQVPITEYHWEPYWANRWNPFSAPYLAYRYVPRTRWETRTQEIRTPVTRRELVPQVRTVQVPVTTQRMVDAEYIARVPVSASTPTTSATASKPNDPFAAGAAPAKSSPIGGLFKMESDPPRQGATGWQPANPVRR